MSTDTGIEWTDATWNVLRGCSRVSAGCQHCYAEAVAARFSGPGLPYEGLARRRSNGEPQWTGEVRFIESKLNEPLKWREPRRVFVNSMSDLFHENVSDEVLDRIFAVMAQARRHTFQILTKRPQRMLDYCNARSLGLPLPNVWLGVSTENQETADERIPLLLQTPAAVRFISAEPLLGPIEFDQCGSRGAEDGDPFAFSALRGADGVEPPIPGIDWVIVGGESGAHARPCNVEWIEDIVAQCEFAGTACFVKQLGSVAVDCELDVSIGGPRLPLRSKKGGDMAEWPERLRVRQFPRETVAAAGEGGGNG